MTKKHFAAFAQAIAEDVAIAMSGRLGEAESKRTIDAARYAAYKFVDVASTDNPRFDRERFLRACGLL